MTSDDVPTKPLPIVSDAGAPTERLSAELIDTAPIATPAPAMTMPRDRSWLAPLLIGVGLVVLLILGVAVLPPLLAGDVAPAPTSTPTVEVPAPAASEEAPVEEAPAPEQTVVVPVPVPTEILPEPSETPVEPDPSATP